MGDDDRGLEAPINPFGDPFGQEPEGRGYQTGDMGPDAWGEPSPGLDVVEADDAYAEPFSAAHLAAAAQGSVPSADSSAGAVRGEVPVYWDGTQTPGQGQGQGPYAPAPPAFAPTTAGDGSAGGRVGGPAPGVPTSAGAFPPVPEGPADRAAATGLGMAGLGAAAIGAAMGGLFSGGGGGASSFGNPAPEGGAGAFPPARPNGDEGASAPLASAPAPPGSAPGTGGARPLAPSSVDREESGSFPLWSAKRYRWLFDVDTRDVGARILRSTAGFWRTDFLESVSPRPDLYGPFWVPTTLAFVGAVTGNMASYLQYRQTEPASTRSVQWYGEVDKVGASLGTFLGYVLVGGLLAWAAARFSGGARVSPAYSLCAYGYSLAAFIPAAALCAIPKAAAQWTSIAVATVISGAFLVQTLRPLLADVEAKRRSLLLVAAGVAHGGLGVALKFYFFRYKDVKQ